MDKQKLAYKKWMDEHGTLFAKADADYINAMSLLSSIALIRTLSCKRFSTAVRDGSKPPHELVQSLSKTMGVAKELTLSIPGSLQARALEFVESKGK